MLNKHWAFVASHSCTEEYNSKLNAVGFDFLILTYDFKVRNVQVSDTTGDATKNKKLVTK